MNGFDAIRENAAEQVRRAAEAFNGSMPGNEHDANQYAGAMLMLCIQLMMRNLGEGLARPAIQLGIEMAASEASKANAPAP